MKGFILTVISFLIVLVVINTGFYGDWFRTRPVKYWSDFLKEKDDTLTPEGIMKARYGITYTIAMSVKQVVEQRHISHPVILLEPNSYYRDSLHIYPNVRAPEPAVFYYYTGMEGVWINSPDTSKVNLLVRVSKKGVKLDIIHSPQERERILAYYRKYTPIL
ncbi:MAG TPA: hypothetical protein VN616_10160 [Puia sp.]|nr:hypothetical protein [Puia sp.]